MIHEHQHIGFGAERDRVEAILLPFRGFGHLRRPVRRRQSLIGHSRGEDAVVHQVNQRAGHLRRVAGMRGLGSA